MTWDEICPEINVEYIAGMPIASFFDDVPENSLVVMDDLWTEACQSPDIVKAFKVFSRKMKISLVIISQCYFGGKEGGREIRNNVDTIVLFQNHGDADLNTRIMRKLGYMSAYRQSMEIWRSRKHPYIVINCSAKLPNNIMRVSTNLFAEIHPYVEFFA